MSNGRCVDAGEGTSSSGVGVASWIWFDEANPAESAPGGTRFFRKTFDVRKPTNVVLDITADDEYQVFLNGDQVAAGRDSAQIDRHDVTSRIRPGRNVLAVSVVNHSGPAGLLARCLVFTPGHAQAAIRTDDSWRVSDNEVALWNSFDFDDSGWAAARELGGYGIPPWGETKWSGGEFSDRFHVPAGFRVQEFAAHAATGPVVRITFDEQGRMLAGRDGGPILLLKDTDRDGHAESVSVYADQVRYCQGLVVVDGSLYAVGLSEKKEGLFRLRDSDGDDRIDRVEPLDVVSRHQGSDEHGPHQVLLGPDGWLYWSVGNFATPTSEIRGDSPANRLYEGSLLEPRYESISGHAAGVKAPGGSIYRWDPQKATVQWERVGCGLRNNYDMAFNRAGDLFVFDSDMEPDEGMPWYRPVRGCHIVPGADFGWCSGSSKWPSYYLDSLPAAVETGRGSPTGVAFYQHNAFPEEYDDVLFVGDWSRGAIHQVRFRRAGASWRGSSEVFMTGRPLNVTDVKVGPDGALYFACGGRGSEGGIFRVVWEGKPSLRVPHGKLPKDVVDALRQPQPNTSWARAENLRRRREAAVKWDAGLKQVALQSRFETKMRRRALDLMHQYGPTPTTDLLIRLASDGDSEIRSQAIRLMAFQDDHACRSSVIQALGDPAAHVRREACETITRMASATPIIDSEADQLLALLADDDRWVRFAARRGLQEVPVELWRDAAFAISDLRAASSGFVALLNTDPDQSLLDRLLDRQIDLILASGSDADADALLDLIRTIGLCVLSARRIDAEADRRLRTRLLDLFPSDDWRINREVARLLAYFQEPRAVPKFMERLAVETKPVEQVHLVVCSRYIDQGWSHRHRRQLLSWLERCRTGQAAGHDAPGYAYLDNLARDVAQQLDSTEVRDYLRSVDWPYVALAILESLNEKEVADYTGELIELDRRLRSVTRQQATELANVGERSDERIADLRQRLVVSLGMSRADAADVYLRQLFDEEPDYRAEILAAFVDRADVLHWEYLVRGLMFLSGESLVDCVQALTRIDQRPSAPDTIRQAIIAGLKLDDRRRPLAASLLAGWVDIDVAEPDDPAAMAKWQRWFAEQYPDSPSAELPTSQNALRWQYDQLLQFLTNQPSRDRSPKNGGAVFEKAKCAACHRFGRRGESIGPDLSTVRQRFQTKEVLEAILFPSHVISDQFRSYVVTTLDGRIQLGMVTPLDSDTIAVIDSEGKKRILPKSQIESQLVASVSVMPEGLLDPLSLREIADLFAFMEETPIEAQGGD
jgi:putative membrane-bound dehydrogenase-like protein